MKKRTKLLYFNAAIILLFVLLLVGCSGDDNEDSKTDPLDNDSDLHTEEEITQPEDDAEEPESTTGSDDSSKDDSTEDSFEEDNSEGKELSEYPTEVIEYARVWLQLGPNQEIDELNVRYISAGELINPNDDTSATYPEDVIQLSGSRLVDGSVTYSGNGDGTINVYNVPLRWDGIPADELDEGVMRKETEEIVNNTTSVYIEPAEGEELIELMDIIVIHYEI